MKTIIVCCLALMLGGKGVAQSNNPYAQVGKEYLASYERVVKDYQEGKIRELNEATLKYYQEQLPLKHSMNMDLAADIIRAFKNQPISLTKLINNAEVNDYTRQVTMDILFNTRNLDISEFRTFLESKNEEIARKEIPKEEKQLLLTLTAIGYNLPQTDMRREGCQVQTEEGTQGAGYWDCVFMSAGIGLYMGWGACGIWCGIGGALFFGILSAIVLS